MINSLKKFSYQSDISSCLKTTHLNTAQKVILQPQFIFLLETISRQRECEQYTKKKKHFETKYFRAIFVIKINIF